MLGMAHLFESALALDTGKGFPPVVHFRECVEFDPDASYMHVCEVAQDYGFDFIPLAEAFIKVRAPRVQPILSPARQRSAAH